MQHTPDDCQSLMSNAEVMTFTILSARYFMSNHKLTRYICRRLRFFKTTLSNNPTCPLTSLSRVSEMDKMQDSEGSQGRDLGDDRSEADCPSQLADKGVRTTTKRAYSKLFSFQTRSFQWSYKLLSSIFCRRSFKSKSSL